MRDSRTRTRANSAATKKPLSATSTSATKRLSNEDKRGSSKATNPRQQRNRTACVLVRRSRSPPSCYEPHYTAAAPEQNYGRSSEAYYGSILVFPSAAEERSALEKLCVLFCQARLGIPRGAGARGLPVPNPHQLQM